MDAERVKRVGIVQPVGRQRVSAGCRIGIWKQIGQRRHASRNPFQVGEFFGDSVVPPTQPCDNIRNGQHLVAVGISPTRQSTAEALASEEALRDSQEFSPVPDGGIRVEAAAPAWDQDIPPPATHASSVRLDRLQRHGPPLPIAAPQRRQNDPLA
jgi:hypothetical protein